MGHPPIIDSDTHIVEASDLWTSRLPKKWGDQVMHVIWEEKNQREVWAIEDNVLGPAWPFLFFRSKDGVESPATRADAYPATYDVGERVKLMDQWGIQCAVLYPNASGFSLAPFLSHPDREISAAHVSAYNDYQLEEWVAAAPGRFIPMLGITYWDLPRAIAEIERCADKGFGGIVTTGAPQDHGQPYLRDPHWDPLWKACEDANLSVSFHVANGDFSVHNKPDQLALEAEGISHTRASLGLYLDNARQACDLLLSGILARFPRLNFVLVESGMGWAPFVLEHCDHRFRHNRLDLEQPEFDGMLPSELFRRQIYLNFWFERLEDWHRAKIGTGNLMFETDFPHPTGLYLEDFDDVIEVALGAQAPDICEDVLWGNAAKLYQRALELQGVSVGSQGKKDASASRSSG